MAYLLYYHFLACQSGQESLVVNAVNDTNQQDLRFFNKIKIHVKKTELILREITLNFSKTRRILDVIVHLLTRKVREPYFCMKYGCTAVAVSSLK